MTERTETFHVSGMHCASCEFLLEKTCEELDGIRSVKANLNTNSLTLKGEFADDRATLAEKLTSLVASHGYRVSTEASPASAKTREYLVAVPAASAFLLAFLLLQELGLVHLVSTREMTYGTAFVIGLIASLSTCLAVVGGLVLSISANAAKNNGKWQSQAIFHLGRLSGFFVLGGAIGTLGKIFQLGLTGTAVLSIFVSLVMLLLGLNLLDTFPIMQRLQPRLPKAFADHATRAGTSPHRVAPLLAGIATFFLPCGFTQSMQVYTLTTGSYLVGGATMFAFALGTFPVLALLSFGAREIAHKPWKGTFFKATGIIVIALALFNLYNGLISLSAL